MTTAPQQRNFFAILPTSRSFSNFLRRFITFPWSFFFHRRTGLPVTRTWPRIASWKDTILFRQMNISILFSITSKSSPGQLCGSLRGIPPPATPLKADPFESNSLLSHSGKASGYYYFKMNNRAVSHDFDMLCSLHLSPLPPHMCGVDKVGWER